MINHLEKRSYSIVNLALIAEFHRNITTANA